MVGRNLSNDRIMGEIHKVYSITDSGCGALLIDADFTGVATGDRMREIYVLRNGDTFGSAPMFQQWVKENNPKIEPHVPPPEPTPEERRANMPAKSMVELRAALRAVRTEAVPNGIYAERVNPWVDILGAMFGLAPLEIDMLWMPPA